MKEFSIFIDESGDFGEYDYHSPYYIISMVFHDQDSSIEPAIEYLNRELSYIGLQNHCVHTGPIVRKEDDYKYMDTKERRRIFNKMIYYDNGQVEVSKILSSVFHALLPNIDFKKAVPSDYKLFQVADLLCTMELVRLKMEHDGLSKSELSFFGNVRDLKKNYLKKLSEKEWK